MRYKSCLITLLLCLFIFSSCKENPQDWIGSKLKIPEDANWCQLLADTLQAVRNDCPAIIIYFDVQGCTSCRLKELRRWRWLLDRTDTMKVDLIPIFGVESDDQDLYLALRSSGFDVLPYIADPENKFAQINKLPEDPLYHTFLVNASDEIVLIGTPIYNPLFKEEYMKEIIRLNQPD